MWIPTPVYKILPPIYAFAGITTAVYVDLIPGLLLISAGGIVW